MKTVQIVLKPQIKHGFAKGLCNQPCLGYRSCKSAKSATLTRLQLSVWLKRLRNFELPRRISFPGVAFYVGI